MYKEQSGDVHVVSNSLSSRVNMYFLIYRTWTYLLLYFATCKGRRNHPILVPKHKVLPSLSNLGWGDGNSLAVTSQIEWHNHAKLRLIFVTFGAMSYHREMTRCDRLALTWKSSQNGHHQRITSSSHPYVSPWPRAPERKNSSITSSAERWWVDGYRPIKQSCPNFFSLSFGGFSSNWRIGYKDVLKLLPNLMVASIFLPILNLIFYR